MRNLKRALSLALSAAMLISMMVIGAGAVSYDEFTDKDEIVHTEAVSVLNTLNVIVGKDNGSFDPNGIVTRGEMAKIICVMLNGGEEPVLGVKSTPTFSDIKGHWAEKYIEYCAGLSVIAGRGNGKFDPDATVTGTEAAKMFLTALGYDAKVFNFTGNDWAINVNTKANEPGVELYTQLKTIDPAVGLTRDNTAQMAYNTLNAKVLKIQPSKTLSNGEVVYEYIQDVTFLEAKFSITKYTGVLLSNDTYGINGTSGKGYSEISVRTVNGEDKTPYAYTIKTTADSDLLGQEVLVFEKKNITGEKVVVGDVFATERNTVVTTYDKLDAGLDSTKDDTIARFIKTNGLKLDDYNAGPPATGSTRYFLNNAANVTTAATLVNTRGEEMVVIDNNADGVVDYVLQTTYTLAKVASKDETAKLITLSNGKLVNDTDAVGYDDVAKGDVVLYSEKNGVFGLAKAETLEGEVASYTAPSGTSHGNITVDADKYNPSQMTNSITSFITVLGNINGTAIKLNGTYRFYLDKGGNFLAAEEITAESNYALVLDSGAKKTSNMSGDNTYSATVKLLLADGTISTYDVDLLSSASNYYNRANELSAANIGGQAFNNSDNNTTRQTLMAELLANLGNDTTRKLDKIKGTLVDVTINNGTAVLAPAAQNKTQIESLNGAAAANTAIAKGVTYWTVGGTGYVLNSSTKFFCSTGTDNGSVITGVQNIPDGGFAAAKVIAFDYDVNTKVVKAVYVNHKVESNKTNFYRTSGPAVATVDGVRVYQYTGVLADGTVVTLNSKSQAAAGTVYTYTTDANGYATLSLVPQLTTSAVKADTWFSGTVTAINAEAITMVDKNGTTITVAIDSTNLNAWNVISAPTGATAPAIELGENSQATVIFKSQNDNVVVDAAFVTSLATTYAVTDGSGNTFNYLPGTEVTINGVTFTMPSYDVTVATTDSAVTTALAADKNVVTNLATNTTAWTVKSGTNLIVNAATFTTAAAAKVDVKGSMVVNGNLAASGAGTLEVTGSLSVTGKLTSSVAGNTFNGTVSAADMDIATAVPTVSGGKITVTGTLKLDVAAVDLKAAAVEAGKLQLTSTATSATIGKATVDTVDIDTSSTLTIAANSTLTVNKASTAASLENIKGTDATSKLVISEASVTATNNVNNTNSDTAKFFSEPGTLAASSATGATAAVDDFNRIKAGTYVWNTTDINAGQSDPTTNESTPLAAWLLDA